MGHIMSKYGYKMINPPARCHGWRYEKTIHIHPPIQRVGFSQKGTRNTGAYVSINDDYTIHSVVSKILSEILINERVLMGFVLFLERSSNWYDKKIQKDRADFFLMIGKGTAKPRKELGE